MASPGSLRARLGNAFSLRRRMIALCVVAVLVAGGSSYATISALRESSEATDEAMTLARVQYAYQASSGELVAMGGAVLQSIIADLGDPDSDAATPVEAVEGAVVRFEREQDELRALDADGTLAELGIPDVADAQDAYIEQARLLAQQASTDPLSALTALGPFLTDAQPLFVDLGSITTITETAADEAAANAEAAEQAATRSIIIIGSVGALMIIAVTTLAAYSMSRQLTQLSKIARSMAAGDLQVRNEIRSADALGGLARSFDEMADSFEDLVGRLESEASRDAFRRRLFDAFEMAADDSDVRVIVADAMSLVSDQPMEMLLSDSSQHHVTQAVTHRDAGAPNCPVGATGQCVAVRRGHRLVFDSSSEIDACPHLKRRETPCSAVCVPVTFNGKAMGVIHTTGEDGVPADDMLVDRLAALASQTGARLGTINAFQGAREQATIDGLTGLKNRRTLQNEARAFAVTETDYALIMCDLDHFKDLNDHYGHEMGDRALRLFSQVLRESTRNGDVAARLGGEEFVILQPRMSASDSIATVERIQLALSARLEVGDGPSFTASFGVSDTSMASGFESVLRVADAGLLAAKGRGRDRWVIGDPAMANELANRHRPRGSDGDLVDPDHGPTVLPERI